MIIYGQRTADGRFAFGGRGTPYHLGSADPARRSTPTRVCSSMLHDTLRALFPALGDAAITHRWGGAVAVPRDWYPSVGFDRARGIAWAGGYVGDGVSTTNLAGPHDRRSRARARHRSRPVAVGRTRVAGVGTGAGAVARHQRVPQARRIGGSSGSGRSRAETTDARGRASARLTGSHDEACTVHTSSVQIATQWRKQRASSITMPGCRTSPETSTGERCCASARWRPRVSAAPRCSPRAAPTATAARRRVRPRRRHAAPATTPTTVVDRSKPWWLRGDFAPVGHQTETFDLKVEGSLPKELVGPLRPQRFQSRSRAGRRTGSSATAWCTASCSTAARRPGTATATCRRRCSRPAVASRPRRHPAARPG